MNPTRPSRREMLAAGAAGAMLATAGCDKLLTVTENIVSVATEKLGQTVPDSVAAPAGATVDPIHHLLGRATHGTWPGDVERVRAMGATAWIEEQLHPESIRDELCELRTSDFAELSQQPGECFEYDKPVLREDMSRHTLLKALYTRRQLYEVMVGFWTDHLNINIEKGDCIYLKPADDRNVVRKHALGKFRDMIRASATSPAMLVYLDGDQNRRATPRDVPNENYGRELLELHTLGVNGGYTQHDVYEAARALTGWRVRDGWRAGTVYFDPASHDNGEKTVLGQIIPAGGGEKDIDRLVEIACAHPSTARHIATKLVKRLVAEDVPQPLVTRVAEVFRSTDGDIKSMVRTILTSDEFAASSGAKFKTPFRFVVSALRALGADTYAHAPLIEYLVRMGQGVFQYPTPDGYPDKTSPWLGTLLWRWNLGFALATDQEKNQVPSVKVPLEKLFHALKLEKGSPETAPTLFRYFAGHDPSDEQLAAIATASSERDMVGLILASPSFQRY